jgi:hypothetical protein
MHQQRMQARVAEQDLKRASGRGIPFLDDREVCANAIQH